MIIYPRGRKTLRSLRQVRLYSAPVEQSVPLRKQKYVPDSGTYPKGFLVSGVHVGIKPGSSKVDLALLHSERPCVASSVFTKNKVKAAPILYSYKLLRDTKGQSIQNVIINSGCANAVTGEKGLIDAKEMAEKVDACIPSQSDGSIKKSTMVMSTGVIGQRLPIQKIIDGIPKAVSSLGSSHDSWISAARAICTTDTFPKLMSTTFSLPSSPAITYSLAGITKGAGMINPNMATLLGVICTDAPISRMVLLDILRMAVARSFNCISIDNDTSTNDSVALLANGAAGGREITSLDSDDGQAFLATLRTFAKSLAQLVVRDGEGATKLIHLHVKNAHDNQTAKRIAKAVGGSSLVKTAMYGQDANWGRILCAIGNAKFSKAQFDLSQVSVAFLDKDGTPFSLLDKGEPQNFDEERAKAILQEEDIRIVVDMGSGSGGKGTSSSDLWFCDFSHGETHLMSLIE